MAAESYERLTKGQLEALRLIPELRDHKLVARRLGISLDALRERLRDARATLGVSRSWDAAMIVQKREVYTRDVDIFRQLIDASDDGLAENSSGDGAGVSAFDASPEEASSFWRRVESASALGRRRRRDLFLRRSGGQDNDLTIVETLLAIGLTLLVIAVSAFFIAMAMEAFSRHRSEVGGQPQSNHSN